MQKEPFITTLLKTAALIFVSLTTITLFFISFGLVVAIVIGAIAGVAGDGFEGTPLNYKTIYGEEGSGDKVLSLKVSGLILGDKDELQDPFALFEMGVTYGYEVKSQLQDAAEDDTIKAVILEINSPGGTIYGSRAIADGITDYQQKTKKPVFAFISGIGASGAYYAASPSDAIYADHGSTIGSVGVIFGPFKYYDSVISEDGGVFVGGVVTQDGIDTTYFTAGKSKDIGNPYRQLTSEEVETMQKTVNNEYDSFVNYVTSHRQISPEKLRTQIGAMIYDNTMAGGFGLIDGTKNKEEAYGAIAKKVGLSQGDFTVVTIRQEPTIVQLLLESVSGTKEKTVVSCSHTLGSVVLAYHGDISTLCQ